MGRREARVGFFDADFLVDGCLFVFDGLLKGFQCGGVRGGVVCAEDLDVFVCERV
jgi:hypothetical protein